MSSEFLTAENIIFFSILAAIALVVLLVVFAILWSFFKFLADLFNRLPGKDGKDSGADLSVDVKELEESRKERLKIESQKKIQHGPKLDYVNYPAKKEEKDEQPKISDTRQWSKKEEKDIEAGLEKLKGKEQDATSFLNRQSPTSQQSAVVAPKIEIPVSKKFSPEQQNIEAGLDKLKGIKDESKSFLKPQSQFSQQSAVVAPKIEIPVAKKFESAPENKPSAVGTEQWFRKEEKDIGSNLDKLKAAKNAGAGQKDDSIFGGKEEISRIDMRQKLRSAKTFSAEKQVGLYLSPIQRAKLEKEVFSSAFGRNISKTDLKWGVKKLNQKMLGTSDAKEHEKIRKEIKFLKKIGGIK